MDIGFINKKINDKKSFDGYNKISRNKNNSKKLT